ncbi:MAG: Hpt domain-containing protein [Alphaproteobacteria bacterium]|nr:Hpt domain-containing protein [Alphaproteobacteria bacterium]
MATKLEDRPYGVVPPNFNLQRRMGGPLKPLDEKQIDNVAAALEDLASEMGDWIKTDLNRLTAARNAFLDNKQSLECIDNLHRAAHDLKGLGQTYGFPIVSAIADTLCKSIQQTLEKGSVPEDLVNAHVDALRAVVNLNLRDADSGPGVELLRGLGRLVEKKTA